MSDDSGRPDGRPTVESLRLARQEARTTLDQQVAALDDVDAKALSVFRLDVALVGVLLSALSFAAAADITSAAAFLNPFVGIGVGLFVCSAAAAGLTYASAGQTVGIGASGLEDAAAYDERAYLEWLVGSYAAWIRTNDRTNGRKATLVTVAVLGTVAGTLTLAIGVFVAFTGEVLLPTLVTVGGTIALVVLSDLPTQLRELRSTTEERGSGTVAPQSISSSRPAESRSPFSLSSRRPVDGGDDGE